MNRFERGLERNRFDRRRVAIRWFPEWLSSSADINGIEEHTVYDVWAIPFMVGRRVHLIEMLDDGGLGL